MEQKPVLPTVWAVFFATLPFFICSAAGTEKPKGAHRAGAVGQGNLQIGGGIDGVTELNFDFAKLEYLSSAGLRVLLAAQKVMNRQGSMTICNVNETIMEVFEITGFVDILTIR